MEATRMIEAFIGQRSRRRRTTRASDLSELHAMVGVGVPAGVIDRIEKRLDLSALESARLLAVSPSSRKRFKRTPRRRLDAAASDRIIRLIGAIADATDVFGDEAKAIAWFKTPSLALGGERPLDLVTTDPGARLVRGELDRIRYGHWA